MRDYAKVGGRRGRPAYRTPSGYILKKFRQMTKRKVSKWKAQWFGKNIFQHSNS